MAIFLTEVRTRHALLVKNKTFAEDDAENKGNQTGKNRDQPVMVQEESDDDDFQMRDIPAAAPDADDEVGHAHDDKKKLRFNTTYNGFNIWGFVLCLLVERKGGQGKTTSSSEGGHAQALMEEWISTQQAQNDDD